MTLRGFLEDARSNPDETLRTLASKLYEFLFFDGCIGNILDLLRSLSDEQVGSVVHNLLKGLREETNDTIRRIRIILVTVSVAQSLKKQIIYKIQCRPLHGESHHMAMSFIDKLEMATNVYEVWYYLSEEMRAIYPYGEYYKALEDAFNWFCLSNPEKEDVMISRSIRKIRNSPIGGRAGIFPLERRRLRDPARLRFEDEVDDEAIAPPRTPPVPPPLVPPPRTPSPTRTSGYEHSHT